jgi:aspartyl-tRNA(Asn)/glutamyl-tRNA(Gln) amidotransferase subunit A
VPFAIAALGAEPDTAAEACGVTALRPTYGVLSRHGAVLGSFTLAALGPVARSAEDCALVLDALAGADPRDPTSVGAPPGIALLAAQLPRGLRVGIVAAPPPAREAQEAWAAAQEALGGAGAIVEPAVLPELPWAAVADVLATAEGIVIREDVLGPAGGARAGPGGASAADYVRASRLRGEAQRALARLLERHDLLLSPAPRPSADGAGEQDPLAAAIALGGLPALTLPIGLAGTRPVGARFVAPPLEEGRLLSAAALFQSRSSHHLQRPPASALSPIASVTPR